MSSAAFRLIWFVAPCIGCGDVEGNVIVRVRGIVDGGGCGSVGSCDGGRPPLRECAASSDCAAVKPICEPKTGMCVECVTSQDCTSSVKSKCNTTLHVCAECTADADCIDPRETCSTALNRCAAPCQSDTDCRSDDPLCDLAIGFCVGCRAVTDCTDPLKPYCVEGDCVACQNGQC